MTTTAAPVVDAPTTTDVDALEAAFAAPSASPQQPVREAAEPARAKWSAGELFAGALFAAFGIGMAVLLVLSITG